MEDTCRQRENTDRQVPITNPSMQLKIASSTSPSTSPSKWSKVGERRKDDVRPTLPLYYEPLNLKVKFC